ncbi:MAG TPA: cupin domain-containing protein [Xanthobacteraceae bacterium]|nr:cupin domain-containing protein [Xanthobacteraceae bacterium]
MSAAIIFAVPADVELAPAPIPPSWIVDGAPQAFSKRLAMSADGTSSVMAWSCTPGRFHWHYHIDETLHIISGEVFVTDEKGECHRLGAGDMVFFPAGTSSFWHVTKQVRKLAFCRHTIPMPVGFGLRVWNKLKSVVGPIFGGEAEEGDPLEAKPQMRGGAEGAASQI